MPDSVASISCVSKKWAKRHNLQITEDEENISNLFNAEGRKIKVTGTTLMKVQHPKGSWVPCVVLVCPELGHEMLLSLVDQKRMNMIHEGWPFELVENKNKLMATAAVAEIKTAEKTEEKETPIWPPNTFSEKMKDLVKEYEDVLVENLKNPKPLTVSH